MKNLDTYLEDMCATPANTMGMGNPMAPGLNGEPGSEPCPTCNANQHPDPKRKRRKKKTNVDEAMAFPLKKFFAELANVFAKYNVMFVNDAEGTYFEDKNGNVLFDVTQKYMTPDAWMRTAVHIK